MMNEADEYMFCEDECEDVIAEGDQEWIEELNMRGERS